MSFKINFVHLAFETCALDPDCASKTVKNYMKRYRKVCTSPSLNLYMHRFSTFDDAGLQYGRCRELRRLYASTLARGAWLPES